MKFRILSESLAAAKKKYGDKVDVDYITKFDPSPTKKYLEFLCKNWDEVYDWHKRTTSGEDVMIYVIQEIFKKFDKISKNLPKKDINQYKNWDEFSSAVEEYETRTDKRNPIKTIHPESEFIFKNDEIVVIRVDSWEASCQYGAGKFCIADYDDYDFWQERIIESDKFFYIFEKNNVHRPYVIQLRRDYSPMDTGKLNKESEWYGWDWNIEFIGWDYTNKKMDGNILLKKFKIPKKILLDNYDVPNEGDEDGE